MENLECVQMKQLHPLHSGANSFCLPHLTLQGIEPEKYQTKTLDLSEIDIF